MANEDVLEELYYWVGRIERNEPGASEYIETLAAALREAREKLSAFEKVGKAAGKVLHDGLQREAALKGELREAREKQKQLEARVAELEEDGCWLSERCASCGHRFAYPADHCPRCGVKVGPNEPDVYPELCECPRCIVARNVAIDAAMKPPGGEGSGHE